MKLSPLSKINTAIIYTKVAGVLLIILAVNSLDAIKQKLFK